MFGFGATGVGEGLLGQTQRRRCGSKKTDYDTNQRFLHSSECRSLTFCPRRDFPPDLPCPFVVLLYSRNGGYKVPKAFSRLSIAGVGSESDCNVAVVPPQFPPPALILRRVRQETLQMVQTRSGLRDAVNGEVVRLWPFFS